MSKFRRSKCWRWEDYNRFSDYRAINSLYYYVQAAFKPGYNRYVGFGEDVRRIFYLNPLSLKLYRALGGALAVTFSAVAFLFAMALTTDFQIVVLLLLTPVFWYAFFEGLNYNAFGWALFPVFLHALLSGNFFLITAILLCYCFLSTTICYISYWLIGAAFVAGWDIRYLAVGILPSVCLLWQWRHAFFGSKGYLRGTLDSIGFFGRNKKLNKSLFTIKGAALIAVYAIVPCAYMLTAQHPRPLVLVFLAATWLMTLLNFTVSRFADDVTIHLLNLCLGLAAVNESRDLLPAIALLFQSWLAAHSFLLTRAPRVGFLRALLPGSPVNVRPGIEIVETFLSDVPRGSRVLFENYWNDLRFHPYRSHLNIFHLVGIERELSILPDDYVAYYQATVMEEQLAKINRRTPIDDIFGICRDCEATHIIAFSDGLAEMMETKGCEKIADLDFRKIGALYPDAPIARDTCLRLYTLSGIAGCR